MALFDFNVTTCKTTQKWQKEGHITTPVPVDPNCFKRGVTQKSCINFFKKKLDSVRHLCNMQGHELAVKNTGTSFNRD